MAGRPTASKWPAPEPSLTCSLAARIGLSRGWRTSVARRTRPLCFPASPGVSAPLAPHARDLVVSCGPALRCRGWGQDLALAARRVSSWTFLRRQAPRSKRTSCCRRSRRRAGTWSRVSRWSLAGASPMRTATAGRTRRSLDAPPRPESPGHPYSTRILCLRRCRRLGLPKTKEWPRSWLRLGCRSWSAFPSCCGSMGCGVDDQARPSLPRHSPRARPQRLPLRSCHPRHPR